MIVHESIFFEVVSPFLRIEFRIMVSVVEHYYFSSLFYIFKFQFTRPTYFTSAHIQSILNGKEPILSLLFCT